MWNGYSVGHWEGKTLVITTMHLNDRSSPVTMGGVRSPTTTITERLHLEDHGKLLVNETTFEDPQYLARADSNALEIKAFADDSMLFAK